MVERKDLGQTITLDNFDGSSGASDSIEFEGGEGTENENKFRQYCRNHLEQIFENSGQGRLAEDGPDYRPQIWNLEETAQQEFHIQSNQIGQIFLEELIEFSLDKIREGCEKELQPFVAKVYDLYFSYSPDVSDHARFSERFRLVATMNSIPELKPLADGNSILGLVNDLAFGSDELARKVGERISELSVGEVIAIIQMIQSAAAQGINQGEFAFDGIDRLSMIVSKIRESHPSRLVKYSCSICLEQISKLWNDDYSRNSQETESSEQMQLSGEIISKVKLDPHPINPQVTQVARDMLVVLDRDNRPISYGEFDYESLKKETPVISQQTISELENMQETASDDRFRFDIRNFLEFVRMRVLAGILNHEPDNSEFADFFSQNFQFLSSEEFTKLISSYERIQAAREDASAQRARIDQEISSRNEEISENAVRFFEDWLIEMEEVGGLSLDNSTIRKFRNYRESGNLEGAFSIAQNYTGILAISNIDQDGSRQPSSDNTTRLIEYFHMVNQQHTSNWQEAEALFQLKLLALQELYREDLDLYSRLSAELEERIPELCTTLIEKCHEIEEEPAQTVYLKRIEAVDLDKNVNPWGDRSEELAFLRFLWMPGVIRKINIELGGEIDITQLNVSSQVQLLRFLASAPDETFDHLKSVLGQNKEFGMQILQSFLSCGEDREYGNRIIQIAQERGSESRTVFEKYAEIVELISNIDKFVQENFAREFDQAEIYSVTQGLLKKGRDMLITAYQATGLPQETASKLQDYNAMLLVLSEVLKTIRLSGETIELEEIKSLITERIPGAEISENDRHEMLAIAKSNWSEAPNPSAPEANMVKNTMLNLWPEVSRGIEDGFSSQNNEFVVIKIQGKIVAFLRFDKVEGGTYFGSFNVDENARGANLGRMVCQKFVDEKAREGKIFAHCSPMQDVSSYYISSEGGFVSQDIDLNAANTGEAGFDLVRDDKANNTYTFAKKPRKELVKLQADPTPLPTGVVILKHDHLNPEEYQQFLQDSQEQHAQGKVMTAFFRYPKGSMIKYAVFEPAISSSQAP